MHPAGRRIGSGAPSHAWRLLRHGARGAWLALLVAGGCAPRAAPPVSFAVDVRHPEGGAVDVAVRLAGAPGRTVALTSFIQPEALRLESIEARQGGHGLTVKATHDARGFALWVVDAPPRAGTVQVRYRVRPGAAEEARMAGATGYRFGQLDARGGLFGARQIFLLPTEPSPPRRIDVAFLLPPGWTLAAPWGSSAGAVTLRGAGAAASLVEATIGVGVFERVEGRTLRAFAPTTLDGSSRREALRRARALDAFLSGLLATGGRPFTLLMFPPPDGGTLVSVAPGPTSLGLSMGPGRPTRWLSIARIVARARLETREARGPASQRWWIDGLPTWLGAGFSEASGDRSRGEWMERFFEETNRLSIDLARAGDLGNARDPLLREWRAAMVLGLLDDTLRARGAAPLEIRLRAARGGALDVARLSAGLPREARGALARWTSPAPLEAAPSQSQRMPLHMRPPPGLASRPGDRRLDLWVGARTLGLLEQCGCRGQQAGGVARRATWLAPRLAGDPPALAIELGDAVPFDQEAFALDAQKRVESDLMFELLADAGVAASVVSSAELGYGPTFLAERAARLPRGFHLLSANVGLPGLERRMDRRVGATDVSVVGISDPSAYHLGRALEFEDAIARIDIAPPAASIHSALAGAPARAAKVVVGSLAPATILDLVRRDPEVSLIVTSDYIHFEQDPRLSFERPLDPLVTCGTLGRAVVVLLRTDSYALAKIALRVDPSGRVTAAEVEARILDDSIPDDPRIRAKLDAHYERLAKASGLTEPGPIGTRIARRFDARYMGAAACAPCHAAETRHWRSTPHATAFATLLGRRRQGVPGCFACHVTGFRQASGYRGAADQALRGVQCESCHGPGSAHVRAPSLANIVRDPPPAACFECHDPEHSEMTAGNFPAYRRRVAHDVAVSR